MPRFILLTGLLLIPLWSDAQELKDYDLEKLQLLPGKVETYYSKGCETKAKYLQELVQDAVIFFENKLQDTFDIKLLVLNRKDWKSMVGGPYILSEYSPDPDRIEMGINELFRIKFPDDKTLYGKKDAYYLDYIAVHELGHYIGHRNDIKVTAWIGEFFADYILLGFINEKIPEWQFSSRFTNVLFKYLPLKYKSLEDLVKNYGRIDPINYFLYEAKLSDLANQILKKRGWDFMYEYLERFKIKPAIDKSTPVDRNIIFQYFISAFKEIEPGIFDDWQSEMKKTYHPYLVFFILFAIIGIIRFFDNSYSIFTNLGLKTKKRFKVSGVPTFSILKPLRGFDNLKIKRKLKLIMWLRPLMCLSLILIILLLILHH